MRKVSVNVVILIVVCLLMVTCLYAACLWPFNFNQKNTVLWLPNIPGIYLGKFGHLYSNDNFEYNLFKQNKITIDFSLRAKDESNSGLQYIASFVNNETGLEDFVICQWRSHLQLLRRKEIFQDRPFSVCSVRYALLQGDSTKVRIVSDAKRTRVFINGVCRMDNRGFSILSKNLTGKFRLLLGNALDGEAGWKGELYAFSLVNIADEVSVDCSDKRLEFKNIARYQFNEGSGESVYNKDGPPHTLVIPEAFRPLKRPILSMSKKMFEFSRSTILDMLLNILGFIPYGFILAIGIAQFWYKSKRQVLIVTLLLGSMTSFSIEILQIYLPSRDSSIMDVVLNTVGTVLGFFLLYLFRFEGVKRFQVAAK